MAASEFRGLAILGTDWGYAEGVEAKQAAIREIMSEAKEKGFNAVFFQVREAGECFYPSKTETWSTLFNESDPGFDPLQFALQEAHRNGLQLHAQLDVLSAYSYVNKPKSPQHLFIQHGTKWIIADNAFHPIKGDVFSYLDPSNPEVITYLKKQVNELITDYEIDGLYFTQMKYPNNKITKTEVFKKQYETIRSFTQSDIENYAQDILTSCLEALVIEVKLVKPYLTIFAETEPMHHELKGFKSLYPADTYYFQKGISWLESGLIDVLVPRIHFRSKSFNLLYDLYINASDLTQYIIPSLRGDKEDYKGSEIKKELADITKQQGSGAILFSATDALKNKSPYETKADLPFLAHTHMETKVIEIDLSQQRIPNDIIKVNHNGHFRLVDQYNKLSIAVTKMPSYLNLESMNEKLRFQTRGWTVPYRYEAVSNNTLQRPEFFIELRRAPGFITSDSSFQFLFRASPGKTQINNTVIEAYPHTHIFFQEIAMQPYGRQTRIRGSVSRDGKTLFYEDTYFGNMPDTTTKHAVIMKSVSPQGVVMLPPDDILRISFQSHLAEEMDVILLYANDMPFPLWYNGKRYVGNLPCALFSNVDSVYIQVAARDKSGKEYSYNFSTTLKVRPAHSFPLIETVEDFVPASYSLGNVRLGGPYLNEFPKGVRFVTSGKFGKNYQVQLSRTDVAYINEKYVIECEPGMPKPSYNISSIGIKPDSTTEIVSIPWPEPVPYAIIPEPDQNRIRITLYGVHSNSTWITQREGLELIDHVSWQQRDAETYDIYVNLVDNNIWGYDLEQHDRYLLFRIKYPPIRNNIRIAVEAGHGGEWNWGAVGLSGLKEKDVNLDTAEKVRDMLIKMGYDVVEIRPEDTAPTLRERWLLTDSLQADIFVSIHANAGGNGYLSVDGTSTYYHNPFWRDFAEIGYEKLRELPLDEFGMVGSFNYMMCRMSQRPSMLVEQAFMSHAEDEDKLADPAFRIKIAQKIAEAVNEYINNKLSR